MHLLRINSGGCEPHWTAHGRETGSTPIAEEIDFTSAGIPGELLSLARQKGVEVGAGNERAAARASAEEFRIRHH